MQESKRRAVGGVDDGVRRMKSVPGAGLEVKLGIVGAEFSE